MTAAIAIVGRAVVLPGALDAGALWAAVRAGRDLIGEVPSGRWRVPPSDIVTADGGADRCVSARGGYVQGFETVWDPDGFAVPAEELAGLDPLVHWTLHCAREALRQARSDGGGAARARVGAVLGNLSYPSSALSRFAERTWLGALGADVARLDLPPSDARNRFMSGLPAHLVARALGLGAGAFALDAACASSLYAIALACDRLRDGRADVMLAGAVNRADDLFLHVGFSRLNALSPSGRSRPFHAEADGLVPAEGAGVVALKRLDDAIRDGDVVRGVIRGIGLANDGRGRGLLVPYSPGQVSAMRGAYRRAGVAPGDVQYVECHATGTVVGDSTELESLVAVFGASSTAALGSIKANMGHPITAAGVAGLVKVMGALEHAELPPIPHLDRPLPALAGTGFQMLREARPWTVAGGGVRRAAVSAFGFGGNDAHLVVEEYRADTVAVAVPAAAPARPPVRPRVAVVAVGVRAGDGTCTADFVRALFAAEPRVGRAAARVELPLTGLRFPPNDMREALPQQTLLLAATLEAVEGVRLDPERTCVVVGMQCDAEIARHGARWRMVDWARRWGAPEGWLAAARDGFVPLLGPAGVLGAMPNIPANRLNSQLDLRGPSFTVSSEELSGVRALACARTALENGEVDTAIVGAVDLCVEPVHEAAAAAVLDGARRVGGDAAVVLVLKRLEDAAPGSVLGVLGDDGASAGGAPAELRFELDPAPGRRSLTPVFGHAHAASGLLHAAAAVLHCAHGAPDAEVRVTALGGQVETVRIEARDRVEPRAWRPEGPVLQLEAHRAAPALPALPALPVSQPLPTQRMEPAPMLPSVFGTVPPASPFVALQRELSQSHQVYLQQQLALQEQFLRVRTEAQQLLLRRPAPAPAPSPVPTRPAVAFDRAALEVHASGAISTLFGPAFTGQDPHAIQVRMPEPPLLLADRIRSIDAEPGSMGLGSLVSETDVSPDAWYLHLGRMPAGITIESGQADLFLISYLGVDALNRGRRRYRLLGCELTYHPGLPEAGETLSYDIHIDGHAAQGDVRLFFFHYDCVARRADGSTRPILTVRHGQAGFFSQEELADSMGVLWRPETQAIRDARVDAPAVVCTRRDFTSNEVRAFAAGDAHACFGPGYELAQTHTRSPAIQGGKMLFLERVEGFDPAGGPWQRGFARAITPIHADDWFFAGHFKNDPCMPGTLMFEGCLQLMAFYLAACGHTLTRDGWRFEPVPEEPYSLQCRGQVLPTSRELVCEIFVEEVHDGPYPTIYADLLGTVDGLKAFHARRVGLRLVPDWPMAPVKRTGPFQLDHASLMACALGKPSDAFGPMYEPFDDTRRVARLPGPPYHFMTNVARVQGDIGRFEPGAEVEIEYDIPPEAWYFGEDQRRVMPFCVLLEAALQPCGWLASYVGSALTSADDLCFRNLDGKGTVRAPLGLGPDTGTLRTHARLKQISPSGGMIIQAFDVQCTVGDQVVYDLETVFGFFPPAALANQVGLPVDERRRAQLTRPGEALDMPAVAGPMLLMLDRIAAFDAEAGFLRAEKDVDAADWFFKAHFFQDPVQPGSLGLEAMIQLLDAYMRMTGIGPARSVDVPTWKYRGQVTPRNRLITVTMEVAERGPTHAAADASLWVDGRRIYEARILARSDSDSSSDAPCSSRGSATANRRAPARS